MCVRVCTCVHAHVYLCVDKPAVIDEGCTVCLPCVACRRQNLNLENSIKCIIDFLISWMVAVWKELKYSLEVQHIFPSGRN